MTKKRIRYDDYKPIGKRISQGAFRFCVYGAILLASDVAFYTVVKVARLIPLVKGFFGFTRTVDPALALDHIWEVPAITLFGQSSLYLFFAFGAIAVFAFEPAYRFFREKDVPAPFRGVAYAAIAMAAECALGPVLKIVTGYDIWRYGDAQTGFRYTSLAIAPVWFVAGLLSEKLMSLVESFDRMKLSAYGLASVSGWEPAARDAIVVISDVHIGKRNPDGTGAGWFYGIYETYLAIMLYKAAFNPRVKELVFLGDLFDTWLYPVEERPPAVKDIVETWKDAPFMTPLLECVRKLDAVWYVPGNHDMDVVDKDIESIASGGKSMRLTTADALSARLSGITGVDIRLEHGNDGDFFNAPDDETDTVQGVSFGYFVSRFVAQESGFDYDATFKASYRAVTRAVAAGAVEAAAGAKGASPGRKGEGEDAGSGLGKAFVAFFVDAIVDYANLRRKEGEKIHDGTVIRMPAGKVDVTVAEVKTKYSSLLDAWLKSHKTYMFAAAGKSGLDRYARRKFGEVRWGLWLRRLFSATRNELIVVMGHTHFAKVERVMNRERQGTYANSGCVCESAKQSGPRWVELKSARRGWSARVERL
jgi:UDP-2,3-diacylglucosamine pyrophosphatase LpxH